MILAYIQDSSWHNKPSLPSRKKKIASSGCLSQDTGQQKLEEANLLQLFQQGMGQQEFYAQGKQIVHFCGSEFRSQNSGEESIMVCIIYISFQQIVIGYCCVPVTALNIREEQETKHKNPRLHGAYIFVIFQLSIFLEEIRSCNHQYKLNTSAEMTYFVRIIT